MTPKTLLGRGALSWFKHSAHTFLFHNDKYLRDEFFVTSYFIPQPTLGIIRTVIFIYCLTVLIVNLAVNISHGAGWNWAAYFTTLTFIGITLYYGFAAYNTVRYTTVNRIWNWWQLEWQWRRKAVRELPISMPMPLPPDQLMMLAGDSRIGMPSVGALVADNAGLGAISIVTNTDSCSGSSSGIERVQLLRSDHERAPMGLRDIEVAPEIDEIKEIYEQQQQQQDQDQDQDQSQSQQQQQHKRISDTARTRTRTRTRTESRSMADEDAQYQRPASVVHQLLLASQWVLYETFTCYAPLVTLIYWCLLYPTQGGLDGVLDTWMGVSMHAINFLLMSLEVMVFSRCRYRWTHFGVVVLCLVLYLALVYFMVGVYGFYVYPFFETKFFGGYVAVVCLLVVVVVAIIWVIMLMVHRWRDMAYPRWLSRRRSAFAF